MRLTHYLMNIARISSVFGSCQNVKYTSIQSTFYVIDDVSRCTLKLGKNENEFMIITKNKGIYFFIIACIHNYTAPSPDECKNWMSQLADIMQRPRVVNNY